MRECRKRKLDRKTPSQKTKRTKVDPPENSGSFPNEIKLTEVLKPNYAPPVVATTPGIVLPNKIDLNMYAKLEWKRKSKNVGAAHFKELLLQSEDHERMDYTAREDRPESMNKLVKHYIGSFDPRTGELQAVEARKMIIRGTVRAHKAKNEEFAMHESGETNSAKRTALGESFGTIKTRKAIKSVAENAIVTETGKDGGMAQTDLALLDSVKDAAAGVATKEELQAALDHSRRIPKGNLKADVVQEVYQPEVIIGADILKQIPVADWREKVRNKEDIQVASRFVATRINRLAVNEDSVPKLKLLRYLLYLLVFWETSTVARERGMRRVARLDRLQELTGQAPVTVIADIKNKFSDKGTMRKEHIELLITHCCVFACLLDNFECPTGHLRDDLRLEQKELNRYFHEIGARTKSSKKRDGKLETVAKLVLPLQFPKLSRGNPR